MTNPEGPPYESTDINDWIEWWDIAIEPVTGEMIEDTMERYPEIFEDQTLDPIYKGMLDQHVQAQSLIPILVIGGILYVVLR